MQRAEAERLLYAADGTESALLRTYRRLRADYEGALRELEVARSVDPAHPHLASTIPMAAAPLRRRADAALERWRVVGHRAQVEEAIDALGRDDERRT